MNKRNLFILILCLSVLLGGLDFYLNDYFAKIQAKADLTQQKDEPTEVWIKKIKSVASELEVNRSNEAQNLFEKIDLSKLEIVKKTNAIVFKQGTQNFFILYLFDFEKTLSSVNYLTLKDVFQEIASNENDLNINTTDEYGNGSFYINKAGNEIVSLIILTAEEDVVGIEYSKELKENVVPILKNIFIKTSN